MEMRRLRSCGSPAGGVSGVPVQPVSPMAHARRTTPRHTIGTSSPMSYRVPILSTTCTPWLHRDGTPPQVMPHSSPERGHTRPKTARMTLLDRPIADQHVCPSPVLCGQTDSKVSAVTTFADICENQAQADRAPWAQDVNFARPLNSTQANELVSRNSDAGTLMVVRSMSSSPIRQVSGVDNRTERQVKNPDETTCIRALIAAMKQLKLDQESQLDMVKRQLENKFSELKETLDGNVQLATTTAGVVVDLSDRLSALSHACHVRSEKSDVQIHQMQREVAQLSEELAAERISKLGRNQIEVLPETTDMMQGALMNQAAQKEEHRPSDYPYNGKTVPTSQSEYPSTWQVAALTHATALDNDQMSDVCQEVIDKIRSTNSVNGTNKPETTCVGDMRTNGKFESSGDHSDVDKTIQQSIRRVQLAFRKATGLGHGDSLEQQHQKKTQPHQGPPLHEQQQLQQQLQSNEVHATQPVHQVLAQAQVHQHMCNSTRGKLTCEPIPEEPSNEALPELSGADEC